MCAKESIWEMMLSNGLDFFKQFVLQISDGFVEMKQSKLLYSVKTAVHPSLLGLNCSKVPKCDLVHKQETLQNRLHARPLKKKI